MVELNTDTMNSRKQWQLIGIVFGVIIALLAAGYFLFNRLNYSMLYQGLPVSDASAIVAELDAREIKYKLRNGGRDIMVPAIDADAIRLGILDAEAPRKKLDGFELFNDSEMGLTDFAQKIKFQRALQGELARTIMMIDGIENARVHIAIPERVLFRGTTSRPTAAVTIVSRSGSFDDDTRIEGIQRLVAAAVPDLELSDVSVLNSAGEIISPIKTPISTLVSEYAEIAAVYKDQIDVALAVDKPELDYTLKVTARPIRSLETEKKKKALKTEPARDYTLRAILTTDEKLDETLQSDVLTIVSEAAQFNPKVGDALLFKVRELPLNLSLASAIQSTNGRDVGQMNGPGDNPSASGLGSISTPLLAGVAFLFLALTSCAALLLSRRRTGLLTTEEHVEFAKRLRLQIHEGDTI